MNEQQQVEVVYTEFHHRLSPLFPALPYPIINGALAELMIDVACLDSPDKSRAEAVAALAIYFASGAELMRGTTN